jgi:hypothetical protein
LSSNSDETTAIAAGALSNLVVDDTNVQREVAENGGVQKLIELLQRGCEEAKANAAGR